MNKIEIKPHYCTDEEYQELKDYLTNNSWDWQEVSSGEEIDSKGTIEVLQHTVQYSYNDWNGEPDEDDIEHLQEMITAGYNQGELNTGEEEHRGWWKINK